MSPYAKLSISLPAAMVAELDARDDERSGIIARIIGRYVQALSETRRTLRQALGAAEIGLIMDVLNGTASVEAWSPSYLPQEISDSLADGMAEKWTVDGQALVTKLAAMTYVEKLALVDAAERFWHQVGAGENPDHADALR